MTPPDRDPRLSHLDAEGRPRMVDVSDKPETAREAVARGTVSLSKEALALVVTGKATKGDVLTTAQLAGIMAAKRTHELIPLCHPLPLTSIDVTLAADERAGAIEITATVRTTARTGVEMEALTAVSVAALTVYDMLKAAQRDIRIGDIRLVSKTGGASGDIAAAPTAAAANGDVLELQTGDTIAGCREKVDRFCREDFSYRSYDPVPVPPDNVLRENEVRLANRIVARMGNTTVRRFMRAADRAGEALSRLPPDAALWDAWTPEREDALIALYGSVLGPNVGLPRATKVLHKKRPNLIPLLDEMVMGYAQRAADLTGITLPSDPAARGTALTRVLREDVVRNRRALRRLGQQFGLSPLRVLDILVWAWSGEDQPAWSR